MTKISDIRKGLAFRYKNDIYSVVEFQQVKQARSSGFYRVKMRNLTTGRILDDTFNSNVQLDEVRVERREYSYGWDEGEIMVFQDPTTWEEVRIPRERVPDPDLLIAGETVEVLFNTADDNILTVELPQHIVREVVYTEPGIKGDTATNTLKPANVIREDGPEIRVPLFVNIGDNIKIESATRKYVERVK